jgi:hypothetical protein
MLDSADIGQRQQPRRRTLPSSTGRAASRPTMSLGADLMVTPWPIQLTSPAMSPRTPPHPTTSSVQPGKNSSITVRPRASRPCACLPCGTPLRGMSATGNVSRSSTVTVPKKSASARAASRPPMLAPITTACSPIRFMMHPALVAGGNSPGFRWYGAKAGSVLLHRVI